MKYFSAYLFIFLYIAAMFRPVFPLFDYLINQDYIAEFLCINKDKPELECNGKCYISKQLQEISDEKKKNVPAIAMEEYPIGIIAFVTFETQQSTIAHSKEINFQYSENYDYSFIHTIFHPPTFYS